MSKFKLYRCLFPQLEDVIVLGHKRNEYDFFGTVVGFDKCNQYDIGYLNDWCCDFEELEEDLILKSDKNLYVNKNKGIILIRSKNNRGGHSGKYTMIEKDRIRKIKGQVVKQKGDKIYVILSEKSMRGMMATYMIEFVKVNEVKFGNK